MSTDQTTADLPTLPEAEHLHGCPAPLDRVERYPLERSDGVSVVVTRCIECGGHAVDYPKEDHHHAR